MIDQNYKIIEEVESGHWWYRVRRELVIALLAKYCRPGCEMLDIGCGPGLLLKELKAKGYQAQGIDMSGLAVAYCRNKGLSDVQQGSATALPFTDNSFDVILLLDVLEHIENDKAALAEAKRVLKHDGLIIIFVPCFSWLWGYQDIISQHFRRYTLGGLQGALENNFTVVRKTYFNFFLFIPILVIRGLMNLLKLQDQREAKMNNPALNKILYFIFFLEKKLINLGGRFPFGVSALLVAKKYD